jgi:hypothetical protein
MSATHRIVGPLVIERRVDMEKAWQRAFENYFKPLGVEVRWTKYTVRPATNFGEQPQLLQSAIPHSVHRGHHACGHPSASLEVACSCCADTPAHWRLQVQWGPSCVPACGPWMRRC